MTFTVEIGKNEDSTYREHCTCIRFQSEDQIEIDNEMMNRLLNDVLTCLQNAKHDQSFVVICVAGNCQLDDVAYCNPGKLFHLYPNEGSIGDYTDANFDCYYLHLSEKNIIGIVSITNDYLST
jgi:1,4-dihydroxy-2-naphthoyl-CoA synthase